MESLITWILRTSYWRLMRLSKSIQSVNSTVNYSQLQSTTDNVSLVVFFLSLGLCSAGESNSLAHGF